MTDGDLILIAGALLAAGIAAALLASRIRVPSLILFLGVGMAIGTDGTGWIEFSDYELARTVGIIALALILFEGGLTSGLIEIRPVLGTAISLSIVGTVLTAVITGLAAAWLFDLTTLQGMLLGSIIATTDGAAIFALLRGSTLRRKLARTLEGEAGLNDPVAILLVLGLIEWIQDPEFGIVGMLVLFVEELGIGLAVGVIVGLAAVAALKRIRLDTGGLFPVASLTVVALSYGLADVLGGSGFLAVYLTGLALGGAAIPAKRTITTFHEGLAWVAQVTLFLVLGLLVFPSDLGSVAIEGTVLAFIVLLVARPAGVFGASFPFPYSLAERVTLSWAGLRGAVPVVLATFPVIAGVPGSEVFFDIVFFAVLLSTLLQGSTFEWLARRLKVTSSEPALPRPLAETGVIRRLGAEVLEHPVVEGDAIVGQPVRDLDLPRDAMVNVIVRGDQAIPPRGSTRLRAGDRLHLLVRQEAAPQVHDLLDRWHSGPIGPAARPPRKILGRPPVFSSRPWHEDDGDPASPRKIAGETVAIRLRERRDVPGALLVLEDGRYGVSGPILAIGGREDLTDWAKRRLPTASAEERAWLQGMIGALGADRF
ncbi:MAG: potassium/proton antiporter [Solirubrobacterales bacterium]